MDYRSIVYEPRLEQLLRYIRTKYWYLVTVTYEDVLSRPTLARRRESQLCRDFLKAATAAVACCCCCCCAAYAVAVAVAAADAAG